jgi:hypothetical protein
MRSDLLRRQQALEWIYFKIQVEWLRLTWVKNPKGFGSYL